MIPDPPAIRVAMFGAQFCAVESPRLAISATGKDCLRSVAGHLLAASGHWRFDQHYGNDMSTKKKLSVAAEIENLRPRVEKELDRIAAARCPAGVPIPWMRQNLLIKGGGNIWDALVAAEEDNAQSL